MKVPIPKWAKGNVKEIIDQTPKSPEQALMQLQKDCLEQRRLITEALKRSDNLEDTKLLNKVSDIFSNLEDKANQFSEKKRKIGTYLKAIMKVAKLPKAERERYKKLVADNG